MATQKTHFPSEETFTRVAVALEAIQDNSIAGSAGKMRIGTVTTGEPGSNAQVVNVGTDSDAVLNITIPRGDKGDTGSSANIDPLKFVLCSLSTDGWSDTAPYTQTVAVDGMAGDWVPGVPVLALGGEVDVDALLAATEALGYIKMITSAEGSLTFTAPEDKPGAALTLRVPGLVERS